MGISEISAKCNLPAWDKSKIPYRVHPDGCKEIMPEKLESGDTGSSGAREEEVRNVPFPLPPQEPLFTREHKAGQKVETTEYLKYT